MNKNGKRGRGRLPVRAAAPTPRRLIKKKIEGPFLSARVHVVAPNVVIVHRHQISVEDHAARGQVGAVITDVVDDVVVRLALVGFVPVRDHALFLYVGGVDVVSHEAVEALAAAAVVPDVDGDL